jgi:hypothetical protein
MVRCSHRRAVMVSRCGATRGSGSTAHSHSFLSPIKGICVRPTLSPRGRTSWAPKISAFSRSCSKPCRSHKRRAAVTQAHKNGGGVRAFPCFASLEPTLRLSYFSSDRGGDRLVRVHAASSRGRPNFMCFDFRLKLGRKERGGRTEDSEFVSFAFTTPPHHPSRFPAILTFSNRTSSAP